MLKELHGGFSFMEAPELQMIIIVVDEEEVIENFGGCLSVGTHNSFSIHKKYGDIETKE